MKYYIITYLPNNEYPKKTTAKILKSSYQYKFLTKKNNDRIETKTILSYYTFNTKSTTEC